jgi:uncharacterized protein
MRDLIYHVVEFSRRHAALVALAGLLLSLAAGVYAGRHLNIDTDIDKLLDPNLLWRQRETAFANAFPQFNDLIVVVVDGATPDQAQDGAAALTARLEGDKVHFLSVTEPDSSEFFKREGLLLLSKEEVQTFAQQIIAAQPMIGTLAADPTLRGLFDTLDLAAQGIENGEAKPEDLDHPFLVFGDTLEASLAGQYRPLSWQELFTGEQPSLRELRRFILIQPVLDYSALEPGADASQAIRVAAVQLRLTPERGVRVRLTGPVALGDEEFASVKEGAGTSTSIAGGMICLLLFLALRSVRLVLPILVTLTMGLVLTAGFAALAVHSLNLISVAFAVLFIGIAVDFSIQFSVRYRSERYGIDDLKKALRRTARGVGPPLAVAAATTAVGFFCFVPTAYTGVSDLGLISGAGMVIALILNLTVLPALLVLIRPQGERRPVGFWRLAPVDRFLVERRREVCIAAGLVALACLALTPELTFDFNPLNLKDPKSESVSTLFDLMRDLDTTPYTIDVMAPSPAATDELAARLEELPEVARTIDIMGFIPDDQQEKLAIIGDAAMLMGPTMAPAQLKPAPTPDEEFAALARASDTLTRAAQKVQDPAVTRLALVMAQAKSRGEAILPDLRANLIQGLPARLGEMRLALAPEPVTLDTLPAELKRDWIAPDGRARIEVYPKGDPRDNQVLRQFVSAVLAIAPDATGTPISIQASAQTIVGAFRTAGIFALCAIAALLLIVLRRPFDVFLVLTPLILAGLLTIATSVLSDLPLNFANIIALPLLLGVGVAFDIYFVMNWRSGADNPLQSGTARAVLFSALTTATAFGSLALSRHLGTAEMGILLTISLFYTLLCTFFVLPALMGAPRRRR